jgi:hypothetical protein
MSDLSHAEAIASVVSAITAVVAVVGASVVSYVANKNQLETQRQLAKQQMEAQLIVARAQVIAPMRQAWINKLRERISSLIARSVALAVHSANGTKEVDRAEFRGVAEICQEILLLLHPGEPDHDAIAAAVMILTNYTKNRDLNKKGEVVIELRKLTQKVLHDEWEVTKKMESMTLGL